MQQSGTGFADINGAKIHYEISGEGYPLILLHAGIGDSRMWDDQFFIFAQQYRTIRYDARGYGKTEMVAGRYAHPDDLFGLMAFLGIERAYLLGCSMGGSAIIDFTLEHPEKVGALIAVASSLSGFELDSGSPAQRAAMQAAYQQGDLAECAEIMTPIWVDGPQRGPDQVSAAIRQKVREMMLITLQVPDDLGEEQAAEAPALNQLGAIRTPTLVIYGDRDQPDILSIAGLLSARIPGARRVVMPGTAHLPQMEQPEAFNRIVLDFLAGL
jgi:pimeloyl-ACP methyl ester carboxylesterase